MKETHIFSEEAPRVGADPPCQDPSLVSQVSGRRRPSVQIKGITERDLPP